MIISNPFGSCSYVNKGLKLAKDLTLEDGNLSEIEFDSLTYKFFFSEEELE